MTLNADKCHLLVSDHEEELVFAKVDDALIWEEYVAKLLGVLIHSDLSFNNNVKMICKKASQKLTSISRVTDIISKEKRITLLRSFFKSQSSYCPLIWIFCSRSLNNTLLPRIGAHAALSGIIEFSIFFKVEFWTFSGACILSKSSAWNQYKTLFPSICICW